MCREKVTILHLAAALPLPSPILSTFHDRLLSYGNDSLWSDLSVDGDGEWICDSVVHSNLRIAHDSSYMAYKLHFLCSAGVILYCCWTKLWLKVSVTERSNATSNYLVNIWGQFWLS